MLVILDNKIWLYMRAIARSRRVARRRLTLAAPHRIRYIFTETLYKYF